MKKIIIIGNSIAGVAAAEEIRKHDQESEITVLLEDHYYPYQNFLFGDFLAKELTEEQLFFRPKEFFKDRNIQLVTDKKIARVDFKKNKIATEEKEAFEFDSLIISDCAQQRFSDIKGNNKTGIFGLRRLGDIKDILAILHLVETIAIQANCISGLKMACGLKKRNKDVVFVCGPSLLSNFLDSDMAEILEKYMEDNGVRIVKNNDIVEVLGDGDVKAIRLKSGKVIAAQSVILKEAKKDLRLYADSGLETAKKIFVNEYFKTNFENVYAIGEICEFRAQSTSWIAEGDSASLQEQGKTAGLNLIGQQAAYAPALPVVSFKIFNWPVVLAGKTKRQDGLDEYRRFDSEGKLFQKAFVQSGRVVGIVSINGPAQETRLIDLVKNQGEVSSLENFVLVQSEAPVAVADPADVALQSSEEIAKEG